MRDYRKLMIQHGEMSNTIKSLKLESDKVKDSLEEKEKILKEGVVTT